MLPPTFQFTQSNLQDYLACPRRFELRYSRRMSWPAVETAPLQEAERRMQLGSDFHRLVHQHVLGLPVNALTASASRNRELAAMWRNYLAHRPPEFDQPGARLYPEITLSTTLNGYRLAAKYDLLALLSGDPPRALIVDWKTNLRRPSSEILRANAQTRVYPFVLAMSGETMTRGQGDKETRGQGDRGTRGQGDRETGGQGDKETGRQACPAEGAEWGDKEKITLSAPHLVSPSPNQITLQYFFAAAPAKPEIIPYSQTQFEEDQTYLAGLIREITTTNDFPLTPNEKACRFCVYRSFCDRGDVAGDVDEFEGELLLDDFDLDWEQVSEIAY